MIDEEFIAKSLKKYQETHFISNWIGASKPASVLILFVLMDDGWYVLYTRRTNHVENHKGQVSFPGGAEELEDENAIATALRETKEEIGLPDEHIRVLGTMPAMPTNTGFLITPIVARMEWPVELFPSESEVSRIFMVPLDWLANHANWEERDYIRSDGSQEKVVFFQPYEGEIVWGITGRITLILLQALALI